MTIVGEWSLELFQFQFLYPFLLEPLWLDAETLKPDLNISTSCNHYKTANSVERSTSGSSENSTTTSQSKTVPTASKSVDDSHTESSSSRTPPSGTTITAQPAEPRRKVSHSMVDFFGCLLFCIIRSYWMFRVALSSFGQIGYWKVCCNPAKDFSRKNSSFSLLFLIHSSSSRVIFSS